MVQTMAASMCCWYVNMDMKEGLPRISLAWLGRGHGHGIRIREGWSLDINAVQLQLTSYGMCFEVGECRTVQLVSMCLDFES